VFRWRQRRSHAYSAPDQRLLSPQNSDFPDWWYQIGPDDGHQLG
jgi:hypothetical protein